MVSNNNYLLMIYFDFLNNNLREMTIPQEILNDGNMEINIASTGDIGEKRKGLKKIINVSVKSIKRIIRSLRLLGFSKNIDFISSF